MQPHGKLLTLALADPAHHAGGARCSCRCRRPIRQFPPPLRQVMELGARQLLMRALVEKGEVVHA